MKKKQIITRCITSCFALFTLFSSAQTPHWQWARSAGLAAFAEKAYSVAVDASGNSYVTGYFMGPTITFGSIVLTNTSSTHSDLFIAKYDPLGNALWAKNAGSGITPNSISVDASGNSYITGDFTSATVSFGSITITNSVVNSNTTDIFLAKYDPSGNVLWVKSAGSGAWDHSKSVTVDAAGNSYITGNFQGPNILFGATTLTTTASSYDLFVVKYDPQGNVLWAKNAGGVDPVESNSIAVDAFGNSYLTGYFISTIYFGSSTLTCNGSDDLFIAKYDASGNVVWANGAGGVNNDHTSCIAVDASGNSFITGYSQSPTLVFGSTTLTNSNGTADIFVAKYDASGNALWAKTVVGSGWDVSNSIAVDASGNSYVTGIFEGSNIVFGSTTFTNAGLISDLFLAKYDPAGNLIWATKAGGVGRDEATAVAVDPSSTNLYVTGYFDSPTITFGSDVLTNPSSTGKIPDVFIAKISKDLDGINSFENSTYGISIFPNPSSGIFHLEMNKGNFVKSEIEIYDMLGSVVFKSAIQNPQIEIDLSGNAKGIYFYQIFNDEKIVGTGKIIVE